MNPDDAVDDLLSTHVLGRPNRGSTLREMLQLALSDHEGCDDEPTMARMRMLGDALDEIREELPDDPAPSPLWLGTQSMADLPEHLQDAMQGHVLLMGSASRGVDPFFCLPPPTVEMTLTPEGHVFVDDALQGTSEDCADAIGFSAADLI